MLLLSLFSEMPGLSFQHIQFCDDQVTSLRHLNRIIGIPRYFDVPRDLKSQVIQQFLPLFSLPLIWKTGQEFDWTNPDDVYQKVRSMPSFTQVT